MSEAVIEQPDSQPSITVETQLTFPDYPQIKDLVAAQSDSLYGRFGSGEQPYPVSVSRMSRVMGLHRVITQLPPYARYAEFDVDAIRDRLGQGRPDQRKSRGETRDMRQVMLQAQELATERIFSTMEPMNDPLLQVIEGIREQAPVELHADEVKRMLTDGLRVYHTGTFVAYIREFTGEQPSADGHA